MAELKILTSSKNLTNTVLLLQNDRSTKNDLYVI